MRGPSDGPTVVGVLAALGTGLLYILGELAAEAAGEGLVYLLWYLVRGPFRPAPLHPVLGAVGLAVVGVSVGAVSFLLHSERVFADPGPRGVSLLVAPLLSGVLMEYVGRSQKRRGRPTPLMASFAGGAFCAFAIAVTRYLLFF